jgi:diaminopropionate ammonia-lyase
MRAFFNGHARATPAFAGLFSDAEYRDVHAYYAAHPELVPTPLRSCPALAESLGLQSLSLKDETGRYGISAFKIVGVRYAVHRLGDAAASRGLVCATAGNHGRAVARVAHDKRVPCTVFLPVARAAAGGAHDAELRTRTARVDAMRADGATVVEVDGSYEQAVRAAADYAQAHGATIVSDTSWPGYDEVPRWIMAGYTQLFEEAYGQWDHRPDVVLVQGGVGGLVCAAVSWSAWRFGADGPRVVACEPEAAACLLESAVAGQAVTVPGPLDTIMAGLRCAEPSPVAWPSIRDGADAFVSIPDSLVVDLLDRLRNPSGRDPRIEAGPSGACGVAALAALMQAAELEPVRAALKMHRATHAFAVITEGP